MTVIVSWNKLPGQLCSSFRPGAQAETGPTVDDESERDQRTHRVLKRTGNRRVRAGARRCEGPDQARSELKRTCAGYSHHRCTSSVIDTGERSSTAHHLACGTRHSQRIRGQGEGPLHTVRSPIVGTFYESPSPGSPPFVKPGDAVEVGQVLCIVEAMKLMNGIEADVAGEVVKKLVANGQPIEYGQELFVIRPKS